MEKFACAFALSYLHISYLLSVQVYPRVCISSSGHPQILIRHRTWQGEKGEEWSSAQGLESVLISIQSLMSSNPYENEPGYEAPTDDPERQRDMANYIAKVSFNPA